MRLSGKSAIFCWQIGACRRRQLTHFARTRLTVLSILLDPKVSRK